MLRQKTHRETLAVLGFTAVFNFGVNIHKNV